MDHYTDLDEILAVGSHPHTPDHIGMLAGRGVRSVVNLQSDEDLHARAIQWPLMWQLYTRSGLRVTRVPIIDFDRKDLGRHIQAAVDAIHKHVSNGRKTYVHCNAGMNRSPSSVIAYLVAHRDLSLGDATAWVADRHMCAPYPDVLEAWESRWRKQQG